jgi:anaerobic dimethyl sulfoxide reductase subunit B (iron-sulfur subunit)
MGGMPKKPAFYLDVQICTGCKTCMVACKDKNDLAPGVRWRRVFEYSGGEWCSEPDGAFRQDVFAYYMSVSCNHCGEPICVEACPAGAMNQDEDGIVTVDQTKCLGCRDCEWACPYGAPQYQSDRGVMTKCDFCRDELRAGDIPACVAACPTRALNIGEFDELKRDPNLSVQETMTPLSAHGSTEPRSFFKLHKRSSGGTAGHIANPKENGDV